MTKRKRVSDPSPFGFDITPMIGLTRPPCDFGKVTHCIGNCIRHFDAEGQPVFETPKKMWKIIKKNGLYVELESDKVLKGNMHTSHTVSMFRMAHAVRQALLKQTPVQLTKADSQGFKQVDLRNATHQRRHSSKNIVWLNAIHIGKQCVLKTTTDEATQLIYIVEAIIHHLVWSTCPNYVPKQYFVGFAKGNRLVIASEQLCTPSVTTFLSSIQNRSDRIVWHMVRNVCLAIRRMQRTAAFTHRDCHISNVYYNGRRKIVKFIDYDWSSVRVRGKKISVPRHLFDTTRTTYTNNRSVDCCVFLRTLGPALEKKAERFKDMIWRPLMDRYERESRALLFEKSATDTAAMQLYKMSTVDGRLRGKYAHKYGVAKKKVDFEYLMGHYTYPCMTPESILKFIESREM
jgi:hypothetical protein